ncbi:MAG: NADH-quinone oxidoreductase subunit L [Cytophagales bacterium]|nr:MAG: NADH-quinone oxidoreductase subunit L [Cytophagales bacterium]
MQQSLIYLLLLPFCSFVAILLLQSFKKTAIIIAITNILAFTMLCCYLYFQKDIAFFYTIKNFQLGQHSFDAVLFLDKFNIAFLTIIGLVSSCVFIFSLEYMKNDKNIAQYFAYLCLFVWAMTALVESENLLQMYIFWELVGVVSYLLIGFWREKKEANQAAKLAFLTNRIGDIGFLIGIFGVYDLVGNTSMSFLATKNTILPFWIGAALFCGVISKSAQFPLHFWLPKAMQAPTPVSALLHAATMVAVGVYLLIRISPFLSKETLDFIAYIGSFTALLGGFLALNQWDIKKILAYSTVAQLGLMVVGVGVGTSWGAMFHLFTHAFFKAGLFLCAGSFIHYLHQFHHELLLHKNIQDMRNMRHLSAQLPFTFIVFTICTFSLIGLPFTSGFFSKEEILQTINHSNNYFLLIINLLSVFLTALYMGRMWFLIYFQNGKKVHFIFPSSKIIKETMTTQISLSILAFFTLISGYIFFSADFGYKIEVHHSNLFVIIVLMMSILGILIAFYLVKKKEGIYPSYLIFDISKKELYIDNLLIYFEKILIWKITFIHQIDKKWDLFLLRIGQFPVILAHISAWLDRNIVDGCIKLLIWFSRKIGSQFNQLQNGQLQSYLTWLILVIIGVVWWLWK